MVMFGVTHVMAIDGYSSKIVGHSTMPVKNNLTIYDQVYRKVVISHGMWDQVRVDCGKEFYPTLFMQDKLGGYRYNQDRPAFLQSPSTRVNNRVNYPLKTGLMGLVNQETIDMEDDTVKCIVSTLACQVASLGLGVFVDSWNAHNVPGRGIPNVLATHGYMAKINEDLLPSAYTAADLYDGEHGAKLKRESHFGRSSLQGQDQITQAEQRFHEAVPDLFMLYSSSVNGNQWPLQDAVLQLIHIMNTAE
ncbi:hypothetical protein SKAU_G00193480 [Synaphobranchus kaupii]|uniref:Uncharacterized protein n=1 Tax=Synaphobranchus kaupii TaxID=118154 RepID=A0A9Q1FE41_SYNKA|nr:hypothetical protein SKAU_G00193480 [Synaphobranchus kaupii]